MLGFLTEDTGGAKLEKLLNSCWGLSGLDLQDARLGSTLFRRHYREGFRPLHSSTWVSSWCSTMHRLYLLINEKRTFQLSATTQQERLFCVWLKWGLGSHSGYTIQYCFSLNTLYIGSYNLWPMFLWTLSCCYVPIVATLGRFKHSLTVIPVYIYKSH